MPAVRLRTALVLANLSAGAFVAMAQEPCFHMTFDRGLGHRGSLRAQAVEAVGQPKHVPGVRGQALVLGKKPDRGVELRFRRGFPSRAGSISLWLRPLDWDYDDTRFHIFLSATFFAGRDPQETDALKAKRQAGNFLLYKYMKPYASGNALLWLCGTAPKSAKGKRKGRRLILGLPAREMADWQRGKWHHVVMTWGRTGNDACFSLFVDGIRVAFRQTRYSPFTETAILVLGSGWGGPGETAVDEFGIYPNELREEEVGDAFAQTMEAYYRRMMTNR